MRTSTDLEAFSAKASSWVANEQRAVRKETEERQRRKKLSEAKVERTAREFAVIFVLWIACAGVALIPAAASIGFLSHVCAGLGMALLCFLLYLAAPRTKRCVYIFEAVSVISGLCAVVTAAGAGAVVHVLSNGQARDHPMGYLLCLFVGASYGTWARSVLPDGKLRDVFRDESRRRLREETIVFQGAVLEEPGKPCITSWPGKYATAWDCLVESAREGETSAAVVFLPEGTKEFGKHSNIPHSEGLAGDCWCTPLYGEQKPWGCRWWAFGLRMLRKLYNAVRSSTCIFSSKHAGRAKWRALTLQVARISEGRPFSRE